MGNDGAARHRLAIGTRHVDAAAGGDDLAAGGASVAAAELHRIKLRQRRQIADQSARLLQLATELKAAVDNSDACTLSIHIVRKADSIARLAHGVKEEMKHPAAQR